MEEENSLEGEEIYQPIKKRGRGRGKNWFYSILNIIGFTN